jgi:hypothetical protein
MNPARKTTVNKTDIELCFKALGVPYTATPAEVDKAYTGFMESCNRGLQSADPNKVQRTRADMELISDLHFKIKKSVTYQERLKAGAYSAETDGYTGKQLMLTLAIGSALIMAAVMFFQKG